MTTDSSVPQDPQAPPTPLGGLSPADLLRQGAAADTMMGESHPFEPPGLKELGEIFPQFEVLEMIGRGGMGAVYRVRQKALDRIVALKILPPVVGSEASFADRFEREAKALAKLNHPGIVTLHEFGRAGDLYFILMEYVDGVNLRQLLNGGRISPREALAIVPQICDALQFAHDRGIVHRDIKPENLLIDCLGRVKVADFGLAKLAGGEPEAADPGRTGASSLLTESGKVMGTPRYMAPEQIERPAEVDHRADIYALGVVFYQMLTGELPGERLEAPSKKVRIDVRLDEIVLQALERKPELRFQQVSVMKTRVEETLDPPLEEGRLSRWREKWGVALQALAVLLFLAGLQDLWTPVTGLQISATYELRGGGGPDPEPVLKEILGELDPSAVLAHSADRTWWRLSVNHEEEWIARDHFSRIDAEIGKRIGVTRASTEFMSAGVMGKMGRVKARFLMAGVWAGTLGALLAVLSPVAPSNRQRMWPGHLALGAFLCALLGTGLLLTFGPQDRQLAFRFGGLALVVAAVSGIGGYQSLQGRAALLGTWVLVFLWIMSVPWSAFAFPSIPAKGFTRVSLVTGVSRPANHAAEVVHARDLPAGNRLQIRPVSDAPDAELMDQIVPGHDGEESHKQELRVGTEVIVWDQHVERAKLTAEGDDCQVNLTLNDTGAARLAAATADAHGTMRLAVIIDGTIKSAPVVQSQLGRQVQISGFKESEAVELIRSLPGWEDLLKASLPWQWLEQIDAGNYQKSHAALSGFARSAATEAQWTATVSAARLPLGEVVSRVFKKMEEVMSVPGMPEGEYVVWYFETHFAHKMEAVETVVLMKEGDAWKPAGYFIR